MNEEKVKKLIKYLKSLPEEYDMTNCHYDLWEDMMEKIKSLKK